MEIQTSEIKEMLSFTGARFNSKTLEQDYRQYFLPEDKKFIILIVSLSILAAVFLFLSEARLTNDGLGIHNANFLRGIFICISAVLLLLIKAATNENKFDRLVFIYALSLCGTQILVGMTRPPNYTITNTINLLIIIIFYLALLNRLVLQVIPSMVLSLGGIIFFEPAVLLERNVLLIVYILTNAVGILFSVHAQKNRRMLFYHWKNEMACSLGLQQAEIKYRSMVDNIDVGIAVIKDDQIVFVNREFTRGLNLSEREILGNADTYSYISPESRQNIIDNQSALLSGEKNKTVDVIRIVSDNNDARWFEFTCISVLWDQEPATLNIFKNVTKMKNLENELIFINERLNEQNKALNQAATRDELTGIYNRRALCDYIEEQWSKAVRDDEECCILMVDIDNFKKVNDLYGHLAGDEVIKIVATTFDRLHRPYDRLGRWGGEEFVLFLPDTNVEHAEMVAERLRECVAEKELQLSDELKIRVTVSIGISSKNISDTLDLDVLFNHADNALYAAKQNGRNRVCVFRKIRGCGQKMPPCIGPNHPV